MSVIPESLRFENHAPGRLGIGESRPRLSWTMDAAGGSWSQDRARVEVVRSVLGREPSHEVHEIDGSGQTYVPWPGAPLTSRTRVEARVQTRGDDGVWSLWSDWARVETGLLETADWSAVLVGPAWDENAASLRQPGRLRHSFMIPSDIAVARLYITGTGVVEAELNGARVGDEELTPGWTSYQERLRYATFDVTSMLAPGANTIGVWLGDGWWRGQLGFGSSNVDKYGTRLGAQCQLEVVDGTGRRTVIASDERWRAGLGPILTSGLYDGEKYDARLHDPSWSRNDFDDLGWSPVTLLPDISHRLVAPTGPAIKTTEILRPVGIEDRGNGRWIVDFGQNHSGKLRLRTSGARGDVLTFRHSEILIDGEPAYEPLRDAQATDVHICDGQDGFWSPRFTIHGYRYAEVTGWTGPLHPDDLESLVVHSDLVRRGWFECSDQRLNRLHDAAVWGMRSNFVDIPTDCPQRDERLGWTGDVQVFAPAAAYLYDVTGFLDSWLRDVQVEQHSDGVIPLWVPYVDIPILADYFEEGPTAVWSDVAVLTLFDLYQATGDLDLVRRHYSTARAHLEAVRRGAGETFICSAVGQLGDWLDPAAPADDPGASRTEKELVATAYYARSADRLSLMAHALGHEGDAALYRELAVRVRAAYARRFITLAGILTSDTQTAYALTTAFKLWPDRASARRGGERLAELVRDASWTVGTGFAGTPVLTEALTVAGYIDDAYRVLQNDQCPSWLYMIASGGTTTWERWDSLRPDGDLNSASMTSFNHLALGSITDWMHRTIAGIEPAEPGYRRIRFAPRPGGSVLSASGRHRTPYGEASISWRQEGSVLTLQIDVPAGVEAEVHLPSGKVHHAGAGHHEYTEA